MTVLGLHHITMVSSDAQRTVDFYAGTLGLPLVKKTVNFDDPSSYHLYFGDATGSPGSILTFFEWKHMKRGYPGIGGTHHVALTTESEETLLKWKRRLTDLDLNVYGPYDRHYFTSIYFRDPDGMVIEIATQDPGLTVDEQLDQLGSSVITPPHALTIVGRDEDAVNATTYPDPVPDITPDMALTKGMHHISAIASDINRTHEFFNGVLGLRRVKMTANYDDLSSAHWYWGAADGKPGTVITYFEHDPASARRARLGTGTTHHYALAVADEDAQLEWRDRIIKSGVPVSPVRDRTYFKSIYTKDPDGHIVELATNGPGFAVDEAPDALGQTLMLPAWLENSRTTIENALTPITVLATP